MVVVAETKLWTLRKLKSNEGKEEVRMTKCNHLDLSETKTETKQTPVTRPTLLAKLSLIQPPLETRIEPYFSDY
jgi:hypothetical protein